MEGNGWSLLCDYKVLSIWGCRWCVVGLWGSSSTIQSHLFSVLFQSVCLQFIIRSCIFPHIRSGATCPSINLISNKNSEPSPWLKCPLHLFYLAAQMLILSVWFLLGFLKLSRISLEKYTWYTPTGVDKVKVKAYQAYKR